MAVQKPQWTRAEDLLRLRHGGISQLIGREIGLRRADQKYFLPIADVRLRSFRAVQSFRLVRPPHPPRIENAGRIEGGLDAAGQRHQRLGLRLEDIEGRADFRGRAHGRAAAQGPGGIAQGTEAPASPSSGVEIEKATPPQS